MLSFESSISDQLKCLTKKDSFLDSVSGKFRGDVVISSSQGLTKWCFGMGPSWVKELGRQHSASASRAGDMVCRRPHWHNNKLNLICDFSSYKTQGLLLLLYYRLFPIHFQDTHKVRCCFTLSRITSMLRFCWQQDVNQAFSEISIAIKIEVIYRP